MFTKVIAYPQEYSISSLTDALVYIDILKEQNNALVQEKKDLEAKNRAFSEKLTELEENMSSVLIKMAALTEGNEVFRQIMEHIHEAIWIYDVQLKRMLYMNPVFEEISGLSAKEFYNKTRTFLNVIHPADRARIKQKALIEPTKAPLNDEFRIIQKEGTVQWLHGQTFFTCKNNEPDRIIGLAVNITAQKQHIEELGLAKTTAQNATKAKSEFMAQVAHEARNFISSIDSTISMLEFSELTPTQAQHVAHLRSVASDISRIIQDILDSTCIEHGIELPIIHKSFQLLELTEALEQDKPKAVAQGVVLKFNSHFAVFPESVIGDRLRILQVLRNLVGNAIKFTKKNGSITVTFAEHARTQDTMTVQFSVTDTGEGMHPEKLSSLFQARTQVNESLEKNRQGYGLGLYISKYFVEKMGGTLQVQSTQGIGSTFSFTIPFAIPKAPAIKTELPCSVNWPTQRLAVLIVEDERATSRLLKTILEQQGYRTAYAESGGQALEYLKTKRFDLILLDNQLGDMTGIDLLQQMPPLNKDTFTIGTSAAHEKGNDFLKAGASFFLHKPIKLPTLIQAFVSLFPKQQPEKNIIDAQDTARPVGLESKN